MKSTPQKEIVSIYPQLVPRRVWSLGSWITYGCGDGPGGSFDLQIAGNSWRPIIQVPKPCHGCERMAWQAILFWERRCCKNFRWVWGSENFWFDLMSSSDKWIYCNMYIYIIISNRLFFKRCPWVRLTRYSLNRAWHQRDNPSWGSYSPGLSSGPSKAYPPNLTANMSNRVCNSLAWLGRCSAQATLVDGSCLGANMGIKEPIIGWSVLESETACFGGWYFWPFKNGSIDLQSGILPPNDGWSTVLFQVSVHNFV